MTHGSGSGSASTAPAYFGNGAGIRLLRYSLGALQRVSPALAIRTAHRLFCTPSPLRWRRPRSGIRVGWQIESLPFEGSHLTLHMPAGTASGPTALLLHGWGGHAHQMSALADSLYAQGQFPVIVDMPAHGLSAGRRSNLPQFARAVNYLAARLQQRGQAVQVLVAHSLGANAAAHAVSRGLPVQRLVLLAPPASPKTYTGVFASMFGLSEATRAAMQLRIESSEAVLMSQFEPAAVGPRIPAPTLVVHDQDDRINALADGVSFSQHIAGAQLHMTRGLGHVRLLKDPDVCARVADFCAGTLLSPHRS